MTWRNRVKALSGAESFVPLILFTVLWAIAFFAASVLEYGPGVSAWFLPAGLKIAFLLRYGPRFVIPIAVVGLAFGALLWLPRSPSAWVLTDLVPTITYFLGALFLNSIGPRDRPLQTVHQAVAFLVVALSIAAMTGLGAVAIMVGLGIFQERQYLEMASAFLLGDLVGMLTVGPLLTLVLDEFSRSPVHNREKRLQWTTPEKASVFTFLVFALTAGIVVGLRYVAPELSRLPYLFVIPIIFAALSAGPVVTTAIIALVNLAVVLFLKLSPGEISALHSQAIMIALASCGLILMAYRQEHLRLRSLAEASQAALHDLKSPLYSLRLSAERASVAELTAPISSLESMTRAVFENTAFGHSAQPSSNDPVHVEDLFHTLSAQLSPLAEHRALAISFRPTNAVLITDEARLSRILQNLIVNAIEHSRYGGVVVGCRPYGDGARICVYDTGAGLSAEQTKRLFQPGHSASGKSDRGFGLTFSRLIAEQLGMTIGVRSALGRGSCFWIEIPARLIVKPQTSLRTLRA